MEMAPLSAISEDREEGEIVDDDFEDISDNSIIVPLYPGKSVSSKEQLPAISLSSVSDVEDIRNPGKIQRRPKATKKRRGSKSYKKRRNSHRRSTCSGSDSDDLELDKKLQRQIKAAIRRDDDQDCHKNTRNISLRSRLRAMTKLDTDSDVNLVEKSDPVLPNIIEQIEPIAISDESDIEDIDKLRMEALRTTWVNKWAHRKKRKVRDVEENAVLSDISISIDTSETNKENTHTANTVKVEEQCIKKARHETMENIENKIEITNNIVIENNTAPEDDEDVLRALLLASMSKKITNESEPKPILPTSKANSLIRQTFTTKITNRDTKTVSIKNVTQFKNRIVNNKIKIANNQPVQLPEVKPLIIRVTGDSDSEDDSFSKTIKNPPEDLETKLDVFLKQARARAEAGSPHLSPVPKPVIKPSKTSVILEKSSVKLLPKQKQIEYQNLLQKLKNAERKPRVRRLSLRLNEARQINNNNNSKKIVKTKDIPNRQPNSAKIDKIADIRSEARALHKVLKDMQMEKNGRLQIQEKYKVLTPIVRKINEASIERKRYDHEVKRLQDELAEAKKKLQKSQENFTSHVKALITEKEGVDKSLKVEGLIEQTKKHFTSTPIKENPPFDSLEASSIPGITPNNSVRVSEIKEAKTNTFTDNPKEADAIDFNPGDPNDIDKIYSKQKNCMLKYISPLDNKKREDKDDPFSIICPYEVGGNCRDPECVYKHFLT